MSAALQLPMTLDDFLDWENQQDAFHEFVDGEIVAMNGGTIAHWMIQGNLFRLLANGLAGKACRAFNAGMMIRTAAGARYPDVLVACVNLDPRSRLITDPLIVFEVVSPGSETLDHVAKNLEYRATPSIQRYVILEQSQQAATVFARQGEDWVGRPQADDSPLHLPEIGLSLSMPEIYEGAFPLA